MNKKNRTRTCRNYQCEHCGKFYFISLSQKQCPCIPITQNQAAVNFNKGLMRPGGLYVAPGFVASPADAPKVAYTRFA